jgi:sugar O-acyltransferase (sialic acid O-acetyltransferase NeuD family)
MPSVKKTKKLIIVGDSAFAEIAKEYFEVDTEYAVVGFAVESAFLKRTELGGVAICALEEMEKHWPVKDHEVFVAVTYVQVNRLRARLVEEVKRKGYKLASYISPRAFVWRNVELGEHCFVFEDNTIQPFVKIGNNVILWSGNHIGHHSRIEDHCFISSHVCISGFCNIGPRTFLGVNSTIANNVAIGADNWIGMGASIVRNTSSNQLFKGKQSELADVSTLDFFKADK